MVMADHGLLPIHFELSVWAMRKGLTYTGRADQTTLAVNVKVVNVLATVRDKKGKIVNNLTQNDFVLDEDGRPHHDGLHPGRSRGLPNGCGAPEMD